jgi:hypothetical protein
MKFQRCGGLLLLSGWFALVGSAPLALQSPHFPLAVDRVWIHDADPQTNRPKLIYFTIHNRGDRTITAFGLRAEIRLADGTNTQTTLTVDTAVSMRAANPEVLPPGNRFTGSAGLVPPPSAVDVAAMPAAVVFDDDTALGDETLIARIFAGRAVHQRFWRLLEQIVSDVTQVISDADTALRTIDTRLEAAADADIAKTAVYAEIRRRMSSDRINKLKHSPRQVLLDLVKATAVGRRNADAHAQRR